MIYISRQERIQRLQRENEVLRAQLLTTELSSNIAFVTLAENGKIDEITATEHLNLFAEWKSQIPYSVNMLRKYNNILYKCIQSHTSQDDWTPDVAVSLWKKAGDPLAEYPDWSQPVGAQDAYMTGDKVNHKNKNWISIIDNNVWEPSIYGWDEIIE